MKKPPDLYTVMIKDGYLASTPQKNFDSLNEFFHSVYSARKFRGTGSQKRESNTSKFLVFQKGDSRNLAVSQYVKIKRLERIFTYFLFGNCLTHDKIFAQVNEKQRKVPKKTATLREIASITQMHKTEDKRSVENYPSVTLLNIDSKQSGALHAASTIHAF